MDGFLDEAKAADGYQGLISLLSMNNPDRATIITLWDSEEAMRAVQSGVYQKVVAVLSNLIDEPPQVANQEVQTFDVAQILA